MAANDLEKDTEAYLARIRRTIAESTRLVDEANLRIAETDRMLEKQGLTRDQVMGFRFTDEQITAANAELSRRGMEPLDAETLNSGGWGDSEPESGPLHPSDFDDTGFRHPDPAQGADLAERQRKFGMMMKPFQI